jgi:hypothetical protein
MEMDFATVFRLAIVCILSFIGTMALWGLSRAAFRHVFAKKDYFGDKITGVWRSPIVLAGERNFAHSWYHNRCNCCGQKNICELQKYENTFGAMPAPTSNPDGSKDYLCGACGCKYNAPGLGEVKRTRGCTDPIPELRRPATHAAIVSGPFDAPVATLENRIEPLPKISRREAIAHTRAKVSAEEADRLKEPREDIISQM